MKIDDKMQTFQFSKRKKMFLRKYNRFRLLSDFKKSGKLVSKMPYDFTLCNFIRIQNKDIDVH